MLHLEIPNITKAVTKHLPVSKTCQHAPTLNPHVRLQHHAIRIHHQVKIISLLKQISCYTRWMIQSIFGKVFRRHFEDHFTVWYLFRNTLNTLGSIGQLAFCKHKAFKHDRKMHKVSSENRTQSIKRVAEQISDSEMIFKVTLKPIRCVNFAHIFREERYKFLQ
jgi:hypothetical protein